MPVTTIDYMCLIMPRYYIICIDYNLRGKINIKLNQNLQFSRFPPQNITNNNDNDTFVENRPSFTPIHVTHAHTHSRIITNDKINRDNFEISSGSHSFIYHIISSPSRPYYSG